MKKRLAARQSWPEVTNLALMASSTARSRSASAKTMNGGMAAEFQDQMLDGLGRLAEQQPADLGGAGEGKHADARILGPRRDDLGGVAGDDVEDARRNAGTFGKHGERDRRERRLVRRDGRPPCSRRRAPRPPCGSAWRPGKFHGVTSAATPAGSRHTSTSAPWRCEVTLSMFGRLDFLGIELDERWQHSRSRRGLPTAACPVRRS